MLPMKYIPQLIGHTFGIAYLDIHVVVGVAIYPVIDAAILDVVFQFNRESSVSLAIGKLGAFHLPCCLILRSSGKPDTFHVRG